MGAIFLHPPFFSITNLFFSRTFDANDYSNVGTIEVNERITDLAVNSKNLEILVAKYLNKFSIIERYEVGRPLPANQQNSAAQYENISKLFEQQYQKMFFF